MLTQSASTDTRVTLGPTYIAAQAYASCVDILKAPTREMFAEIVKQNVAN